MVPQVALRVWKVADKFQKKAFAQNISEDVKSFTQGLSAPYCGANNDFEAVQWLAHPHEAQSVALLPLRNNATPWTDAADNASTGDCMGLLVLASPDPQRFHPSMGTDVLSRIAELAAAALTRLQ
jgi:uncharacterized protein YigA (DUF484 family)